MSRAPSLLLSVFVLLLPLNAQSGPDELLQRGIARIRDTLDRLPRYLCTQTMDRVALYAFHLPNGEGCDWWPPGDRFRSTQSDRVRADVLFTPGGEVYSWVGESQFHNQDLLQLVQLRPVSAGGFGGILRSVFGHGNVFSYLREVTEDGRKLREYAFRVPRDNSEYWFGNGVERRTVAIDGTFLLDPGTADLVRLVVKSGEPPQVTGACQATTTLNYGRTRVNESEFLLPAGALFEFVDTRGQEARNSWVYSGCHEFLGESTLRFAPPEPRPRPSGKAPGPPALALPEGLPFRTVFTQDIAFRTAADGDAVAAKLATPIQDAARHLLVPAGTPVVARILCATLTRLPGGVTAADLIFRLESLALAGTAHPFVATSAQPLEDSNPAAHDGDSSTNYDFPTMAQGNRFGNTGVFLLAPNTAMLRFYGVRPNFVLRPGKQSKWKTGGSGPTADCLSGAKPCK
jgi:hypothetical protein